MRLKRSIWGLLCLLAGPWRPAFAVCDPSLAPAHTTRAGIMVPQINSCSWGAATNANWSILDSSMCIQSAVNTFTGANTFSGTDSFVSGSELHFNSANNTNWGLLLNPTTGSRALELNSNQGVAVNGIPLDAGTGNPGLQIFKASSQLYGSFAVMGSSQDATTAYSGFIASSPISASTLWSLPLKDGNNGQLLGTDGTAHLSWYNTGGGGGGSSALAVNQNAVQVTSPTVAINALSPPFVITSVGGGTTAQWSLSPSSVTLEGPLLTQQNLWTGFNTISGSTTFSGNLNVSSGVLVLGGYGSSGQVLTSGGFGAVPSWSTLTAAGSIINQSTLQSGATFYVSSGTVMTQFNVIDSNANFKLTPATGSGVAGTLLFAGNSSVSSAKLNLDYWATTSNLSSRLLFTNATVVNTLQQTGWNFSDAGGNVQASISTTGKGNFGSILSTGSVTISSNTILSGATFYQGAQIDFSSAPQVNVSTLDWSMNGTVFQAERCGKETQFTITGATGTLVTSFISTSLSGTITPHSASSYIKLRASGTLQTSGGTVTGTMTFMRNGASLFGTGGQQELQGAAAAVVAPSSLYYIDSPALTSTLTYAVGIRTSSGQTNFCDANETCTLTLQECF